MAALILPRYVLIKLFFCVAENAAGYHLGLATSSTADDVPFELSKSFIGVYKCFGGPLDGCRLRQLVFLQLALLG